MTSSTAERTQLLNERLLMHSERVLPRVGDCLSFLVWVPKLFLLFFLTAHAPLCAFKKLSALVVARNSKWYLCAERQTVGSIMYYGNTGVAHAVRKKDRA